MRYPGKHRRRSTPLLTTTAIVLACLPAVTGAGIVLAAPRARAAPAATVGPPAVGPPASEPDLSAAAKSAMGGRLRLAAAESYRGERRRIAAKRAAARRAALAAKQAAAAAPPPPPPAAAPAPPPGIYSAPDLAALWISAGGPSWAAQHAASIALCESGGNPEAYNPSGATGLWQILGQVVAGDLTDPAVNAKNAVAKFDAAGQTFAPWVCQ